MTQKRVSRVDSAILPRTVRPIQIQRRQETVEQMHTASHARRGYSKAQALRLFQRVAARSQHSLGWVRAELIPESSWRRAHRCLGQRASETAARLREALALAERVWGNPADAIEWMNRPHPELEGQTPYSMLKTEAGGRAVELLLRALDAGFLI